MSTEHADERPREPAGAADATPEPGAPGAAAGAPPSTEPATFDPAGSAAGEPAGDPESAPEPEGPWNADIARHVAIYRSFKDPRTRWTAVAGCFAFVIFPLMMLIGLIAILALPSPP